MVTVAIPGEGEEKWKDYRTYCSHFRWGIGKMKALP